AVTPRSASRRPLPRSSWSGSWWRCRFCDRPDGGARDSRWWNGRREPWGLCGHRYVRPDSTAREVADPVRVDSGVPGWSPGGATDERWRRLSTGRAETDRRPTRVPAGRAPPSDLARPEGFEPPTF